MQHTYVMIRIIEVMSNQVFLSFTACYHSNFLHMSTIQILSSHLYMSVHVKCGHDNQRTGIKNVQFFIMLSSCENWVTQILKILIQLDSSHQYKNLRWIWGIRCAQASKHASERIHPGFETQGRHHQKSKTGVSAAQRKGHVSYKNFKKKRKEFEVQYAYVVVKIWSYKQSNISDFYISKYFGKLY